jgi:hypothetical protein
MSLIDNPSFGRSSFRNVQDPPASRQQRTVAPLGAYEKQSAAETRNYRRKVQKILTLDLSVVRADVEFKISGSGLLYKDSTNVGDRLSIKMTDQDDAVPWRPGDGVVGFAFDRLLITNAAQAGASATLVYFTAYPDEDLRLL